MLHHICTVFLPGQGSEIVGRGEGGKSFRAAIDEEMKAFAADARYVAKDAVKFGQKKGKDSGEGKKRAGGGATSDGFSAGIKSRTDGGRGLVNQPIGCTAAPRITVVGLKGRRVRHR